VKARLFCFIVLAATASFAYFLLALRYVASWPWLLSFYGLPVAVCALLGYALNVWRRNALATNAIAALTCLFMPVAVSMSIMSYICVHERICP